MPCVLTLYTELCSPLSALGCALLELELFLMSSELLSAHSKAQLTEASDTCTQFVSESPLEFLLRDVE